MNERLLARYRHLIVSVVLVDHRIREGVEQYKAKYLLADGSNLRVSEVYLDGELIKYSYFWLDESDNPISGWDNAEHHPEIRSHPHHLHVGDHVQESSVHSLNHVLKFLSQRIK